MTNQELAKEILELVGGKENVAAATNCMTRLRITLADNSKADIAMIKSTDGVLGVVEDETLQVVLGPGKAKKVADFFLEEAGMSGGGSAVDEDWQKNKSKLKSGQKNSPLKLALRNISEIFIPLMPAVIAAGLFNGIAGILSQTNIGKVQLEGKAGAVFLIIAFLQLLGGAFLSYFAIYTGVNAARQFGGTPALGGMIGAMSLMPQIITISTALGWYNEAVPLESILTNGKGGVIGVIFGAWILSKIEKFFRKHVPDSLELIITPFATLLFSGAIFVFAVMPLSGFLSDILVGALSLLIDATNPVILVVSGFVLSALFLPMVLLGLHHGLIPIYSLQLERMGGVSLFPVLAMAGAGQVGAAIAIYQKAKKVKNARITKVISGALPAGLLGVGEPLIYGVTLPMGKPFLTAGLGAGFGGAYIMLMHVTAGSWGPSGLVAIPLMSTPPMMLHYFIGLIISYVMGFIITSILVKDEEVSAV